MLEFQRVPLEERVLWDVAYAKRIMCMSYFVRIMLEIREAREEDRESAMRVLWKAFEVTKPYDQVRKMDWVNRWNETDKNNWAFVAVENGNVLANLSFFITANDIIRGRPVKFAAVWAVATEPSWRKRGLVRGLFEKAFADMREKGAVLSILDPFKRTFYEKFGYALAEKRAKHVIIPDQLKSIVPPSDIVSREVTHISDFEAAAEVERSMSRFGSHYFIPKSVREDLNKEWICYILEREGLPVGTVSFRFTDAHPGFNLTASSLWYKDDDALVAIMDLIQKHAVNAREVSVFTESEVPFRHFLADIRSSSYQMGSMMMRVIDVIGYCTSISIPTSATHDVVMRLTDSQCPWNTGSYRLSPSNGRLQIEPADAPAEIDLDAFQLSQIAAGIVPATQLRGFGDIKCSQTTAEHIESIFPYDVFISNFRF